MKKMSTEFESGGLSGVNVENLQIASLHQEIKRERTMNESL